jgi:hypothetical protein
MSAKTTKKTAPKKERKKTKINPSTFDPQIWEHHSDGELVEILLVCGKRFASSAPTITLKEESAVRKNFLGHNPQIAGDLKSAKEHKQIIHMAAIGLKDFIHGSWIETANACHFINPVRLFTTPAIITSGSLACYTVDKYNISRTAAQIALAYAYKIKSPETAYSAERLAMDIDKNPCTKRAEKIASEKDFSVLWKVIVCLWFKRWNEKNFTTAQKIQSLKNMGFDKVTESKLDKFIENSGIK